MTTVLVNLLWLVPGVVGGSEESTTSALRALADTDDGTGPDIRLAVLGPFPEAHPDLAERFRCEVLDLDGRDKVRRVLAEQTWLARVARRLRARVVHHAGGVVPLVHPGRCVLTVHDLQPLDLPGNFSPTKRTYIRAMARRSVRAARVVAVPSRFTRDRVVGLLGADPARVELVPWSVRPPRPAPGSDAGPPPQVGGHPFLLYPAITYPHKNHLVLLDAFAELAAVEPDLRLVLCGGEAAAEAAVRERMARPDLAGRVIRTGRVPAPLLEALYRGAVAVVVPSRYEGFGLPVLEAMVRGVPVVAADAGSLPEVARPEDLVPPDDVAGWAAAMRAAARAGPAERSARVAEGRRRAARFSPERTARSLRSTYRRAATDR